MFSFDRLGLSTLDVPEAVDCILANKVGNVPLMDVVCGENSSSKITMAFLHCSPGINVVSSNLSKFSSTSQAIPIRCLEWRGRGMA